MIKAEESKAVLERLLSGCTLQPNGSYISENGGIIWLSSDAYMTAHTSQVKASARKSSPKKTTKKKK